MWDSVFRELHPGLTSSEADLARAEAELGFPLPQSYRNFAQSCGAGRIGGHLRIFTPVPVEAADLGSRAHLISHGVALAFEILCVGAYNADGYRRPGVTVDMPVTRGHVIV